ncbi:MAG: DinB-like domain protein [Gemmatimonadetes bacterium]|nr:DinB-like domain protein [Gemmatimonadota bacterium]
MSKPRWQSIVSTSIDWDQAHVPLDGALKGLDKADRGRRPEGYPHSVWELVEHIRIAQNDLLDFLRNPKYVHVLKWPDDYWPPTAEPPSDAAWRSSLKKIRSDRDELASFTTRTRVDLTGKIPHGSGQTYLRTILVATDHASYHIGQIVAVRRLLDSWKQ